VAALLLFVLLPSLGICEEFETTGISAADLAARRGTPDELLVVDVRPFAEYKTGHVDGAVNMPHTELEKHLDRLGVAPNGVVLYCTMGKRTRLAERTLLEHGIPNLFHLEGGLGVWRQGGYPISTGWGP
jgi:rhodanese-related sulfurtransferase